MHGRGGVLGTFGLEQALKVHRIVNVGVDSTGNHELAASVDRLRRPDIGPRLVQRRDLLPVDGDVEGSLDLGTNHGATSDKQVVLAPSNVRFDHATALLKRAGRKGASASDCCSSKISPVTISPSTGANVIPLCVATT